MLAKPAKPKPSLSLSLHPACIPFKPSHLSIPPSPFTPRTPLLLPPQLPPPRPLTFPTPSTPSPPSPPLQWLWQCHQCRRTYSLGVTRRCLEDGHAFCAGAAPGTKTWRAPLRATKTKRRRACASEFDYKGWKAWGVWKRSGSDADGMYHPDSNSDSSSSSCSETSMENSTQRKHCWNTCDYPSACRWGSRFGALPTPENDHQTNREKTHETDFWDALTASTSVTQRRRRRTTMSAPPASPLAGRADEGSVGGQDEDQDQDRDKDGDIPMGNFPLPTPEDPLVENSAQQKRTSTTTSTKTKTKTQASDAQTELTNEINSAASYGKALEELPRLERVTSREQRWWLSFAT